MTVFNEDRFLLQRQLKARAKKAIEQLQLRTLKPGDKVWPMLEFPERYGTSSAQHPESGPWHWSRMQKSLWACNCL